MSTPDPTHPEAAQRTLSMLVHNRSGVLTRVAGLFARRAYNIDSLTVSHTENTDVSRITVVTQGDPATIKQLVKQLDKLVDVIQVLDHTEDSMVEQEIALVKLRASQATRAPLMQTAALFNAEIASISAPEETMMVRLSGPQYLIDGFLDTVKAEIIEMVRSGKIALVRGARST